MLAPGDLIQAIHPNDTMMTSTVDLYFNASLTALSCVERAVHSAQKDDIKSILDFGCGYGRVLRALRARWPDADIVATDLIANAVEFCAEAFGVTTVQGNEDLSDANFGRTFDLIWVGSVFTHLPSNRWEQMLKHLSDHLAPDGVLVFTTHGRTAQWVFEKHTLAKSPMTVEQFDTAKFEFAKFGFAFIDYSTGMIRHINDKTGAAVSKGQYGLSFSRPDWVCRLLCEFPSLTLQSYTEGGWGKNHDVVAVSKPVDLRIV